MIACPNASQYSWGDLQVLYYVNEQLDTGPVSIFDKKNKFIETNIWQWQNGEYDKKTTEEFTLKPNKGYWIYCLTSGVYLRFPHEKAKKKRSIQTTAIDWIQPKSLVRQVIAADSHTPPPPMNSYGPIQVDPEDSNCLIETLSTHPKNFNLFFLFLWLAFFAVCLRRIKSIRMLFIGLICLYASNGQAAEPTLKIEPGRAFFDMGIFAFEDGMYEDAKDNFNKALTKNPKNPYYLQYAGKTYLKLEKYVDAQKLLDRAWSINPRIHNLKFDRAFLYFKIKVYERAIPLFVEIADDSPENVLAVYLAGVSYFKNEQYVKAVQYLIQAAERSPNIKPNAFFYAGIARIKAGQVKNGLKLLKYVQANGDPQTQKLASEWISMIEKLKQNQKQFTAKFSLRYKYDTNVQIEPDDMNLYSDEKDYAAILGANFKYTTQMNDQWYFSMGHHQFLMKYQSLDDYDLVHASPFLSAQYHRYPFTMAFNYKPCLDLLNNYSYLTKHRFNPIIKQQIRDNLDIVLSYEYATETFYDYPEKDGHRNDFSVKLNYSFNKTMRLSSGASYLDKSASHADNYYHQIQGDIGVSAKIPMDITLKLTSKYYRKTYDNSDPAYGASRIDKRLNTGLSVFKQINPDITFSLGIILMYNQTFPG